MTKRDTCTIESLRADMVDVAGIHGSFTHPEVLKVSQQLDILILDLQKTMAQQQYTTVNQSEKVMPFGKLTANTFRTTALFG